MVLSVLTNNGKHLYANLGVWFVSFLLLKNICYSKNQHFIQAGI